jgi:hypothetical protein
MKNKFYWHTYWLCASIVQNIIYDGIVYHCNSKIFKTDHKLLRCFGSIPSFSPNNLYNS